MVPMVTCPRCAGKGKIVVSGATILCDMCGGLGKVSMPNDNDEDDRGDETGFSG